MEITVHIMNDWTIIFLNNWHGTKWQVSKASTCNITTLSIGMIKDTREPFKLFPPPWVWIVEETIFTVNPLYSKYTLKKLFIS